MVSGSVACQLLMVAGRLRLTHYKHSYSVGYQVVFSVQYVPNHTVPKVCFQQLFYKQRNNKKTKKTSHTLAKATSDAQLPQGTIELLTT